MGRSKNKFQENTRRTRRLDGLPCVTWVSERCLGRRVATSSDVVNWSRIEFNFKSIPKIDVMRGFMLL
ncbi:hypothetical protein [uncultured Nitrosomonas sp.]|uniref:hypothetical protein n=1 Tax=uncultured Nitrosomonas sp. TaxID=156424 RepID=UPI0025E164C7|nr:hypothetical protein [uncultured Nitrosomonas sp.]